jgi:glutamine cyclotransferase
MIRQIRYYKYPIILLLAILVTACSPVAAMPAPTTTLPVKQPPAPTILASPTHTPASTGADLAVTRPPTRTIAPLAIHTPAPTATALPTTLATQSTPAGLPALSHPTKIVIRPVVNRYTCLWADLAHTTPVYTFEVINTYPHDPKAYTQGLIFRDGLFYEGTGLYGWSSLRKVVLESGEVQQIIQLAHPYFGEGITEMGGLIYQLTWTSQIGFVYDQNTFERLDTFSYPTEGWGLTHDGQKLLMSDGSEYLYYLDPETLKAVGQVMVNAEGMPVPRLNELEYVEGEVWANVYQTSCIARIDPVSGNVLGWIDISGILLMKDLPGSEVPNGIAYDPAEKRIFITGKWWPKLFEIRILKK